MPLQASPAGAPYQPRLELLAAGKLQPAAVYILPILRPLLIGAGMQLPLSRGQDHACRGDPHQGIRVREIAARVKGPVEIASDSARGYAAGGGRARLQAE